MHLKNALEVLNSLAEEAVAFQIFQIADVLAEECFAAAKDANGVFQFTADGQNRLRFVFKGNRYGNKTAGTAQHLRLAGGDANDGIIAAAQDIAIVNEVSIGDAVEPAEGFGVIDGDGLFAEVGAGHDKRVEFGAGKEEMVKRGVRQKNAQKMIARSNAFREAGVGLARKQDDGPLDGEKEFAGCIIEDAEAVNVLNTAKHDGKRLFDAALPCAEQLNGGFRAGIAGEMKPAEALYGNDAILLEQANGFAQRFGHVERHTIGRAEQQLRPTIPAGVWLRVETAIGGIVILSLAGGAHLESGHGSTRAVVGNIANDGEARAAIGAIDKGITETAVAGIHHFAQAIGAHGDVRRDERFGGRVETAGEDAESGFGLRLSIARKERSDFGQRREFRRQALKETVEENGVALDFDGHTGGSISDKAREIAFLREAIDERAKTDTLDDAGDVDGFARNDCSCRFVHERIIAESSGIDSCGGLRDLELEGV